MFWEIFVLWLALRVGRTVTFSFVLSANISSSSTTKNSCQSLSYFWNIILQFWLSRENAFIHSNLRWSMSQISVSSGKMRPLFTSMYVKSTFRGIFVSSKSHEPKFKQTCSCLKTASFVRMLRIPLGAKSRATAAMNIHYHYYYSRTWYGGLRNNHWRGAYAARFIRNNCILMFYMQAVQRQELQHRLNPHR